MELCLKVRNKFEKNYNDIIANAIHSKMVTTYPIQSKIINEYLKMIIVKNQKEISSFHWVKETKIKLYILQ